MNRGELPSATQRMYDAGQAVGLLLGDQRRGALLVELGLLLDRVAVLVGQHHRDRHVAVGLAQRGQQHAAVPADGVVVGQNAALTSP